MSATRISEGKPVLGLAGHLNCSLQAGSGESRKRVLLSFSPFS